MTLPATSRRPRLSLNFADAHRREKRGVARIPHLILACLLIGTAANSQPRPTESAGELGLRVGENASTFDAAPDVNITEGSYAGRPHFIVRTPSAVYYYDRAGGGLSRLIDPEGRDWIGFGIEPWDTYPASAASSYRGLPNLVYRSDDGGAGHPGHDMVRSEKLGENRIRSVSTSGRWQWTWHFFDDRARLEIERVDPDHAYWFLYEGAPGGVFEPSRQYFGTDSGGPRSDLPDYYAGNALRGTWRWAYFGHQEANHVLFVAQQEPDELADTFGYLGNTTAGLNAPDGMVVFGFGRREGAVPLLTRPHTFYVGLVPMRVRNPQAHERLASDIRRLMESDPR